MGASDSEVKLKGTGRIDSFVMALGSRYCQAMEAVPSCDPREKNTSPG